MPPTQTSDMGFNGRKQEICEFWHQKRRCEEQLGDEDNGICDTTDLTRYGV